MATERDIESDITLEIDGDLVSPTQLAKALTAFSALLNSAHRKCDESASVKWGIQVSKGSNLLAFIPKNQINPAAIAIVEEGLRSLDKEARCPSGYDESMLYNLQTLSEIVKNTKTQRTTLKAWLYKKPIPIGAAIKGNVDIVLEGAFSEYGAVEGKLLVLDSEDAPEFVIIEPLHAKRITCTAVDRAVFDSAYNLYEQRVEAEGMIKYTGNGVPYAIRVDKIHSILPTPGVPDYKLTRGILKQYV